MIAAMVDKVRQLFPPAQQTIDYATPDLMELIQRGEDDTKFTRDGWKISMNQTQRLFLFDNFMTSAGNSDLLDRLAVRRCTAFTAKPEYAMYQHNLGKFSYPIALFQQPKPTPKWANPVDPPSRIKGEIFTVHPDLIFLLDKLHENGVRSQRHRINMRVPFFLKNDATLNLVRGPYFATVTAWMYVGLPQYWEPLLDGGYQFTVAQSYESKRPWINRYYFHMRKPQSAG